MARYIVPAEMPKSCAHCQFSVCTASHPFWSGENPNTKKYRCALADLSIEVDFHDYTTKADWCPLVDASDFAQKTEVAREIFEEILKIKGLELHDWLAIAELKKKYTEPKECPTCKSFVGCEQANWTGPCDDYKEEKR